ncbi:MAG: glucuronate isomerase [Brachybacterium sp.]|nr:glucuronate isomerase [Brachybacterium sp.]
MSNDAFIPHEDRLLPVEPTARAIARELYDLMREQRIVSPHGHIAPSLLADDEPFRDPTSLFITPDHYVTRLMHSRGVALEDLGVGRGPLDEKDARAAWRLLAEHWHAYAGTPSRYWLEDELHRVFGIEKVLSPATADELYDTIQGALDRPELRPRALFDSFGIETLATTDDPCDDLHEHDALAADESFAGRVIPTFRPDKYLEPAREDFRELTDALAEAAGVTTDDYDGYVEALRIRRQYFKDHGAVSSDHAHTDAGTQRIEVADARRIYREAREGTVSEADATALRRHMMGEMARMASDDGLVLTIHPAVHRNHHGPTHQRFGADVGADIPMRVDYVGALAQMLQDVGTNPSFRTVLFTIDETTFSRELAPLAGFYPSVYVGAPWWFIDAPDAILRFRRAVSETIGYSKTSGFIDDTRAFCSIPARHDMARRMDAHHLAGLVAEHRMRIEDARLIAEGFPADHPSDVFRIDRKDHA